MSTFFLVCALFFPRLTLLITWLFGNMPANDTPLAADVIGAIFVPRFLIAWWAYNLNEHTAWVVLFVLFGIVELLKGGSSATSSSGSQS